MQSNCSLDFCKAYPHLFNESNGYFKEVLVDNWMLMGSPYPIIALLVFYLYFVLHWGPQFMANKKPFKIRYIMMAYNLFQVAYNARIFLQLFMIDGAMWYLANHTCHPISETSNPLKMAFFANTWLYMLSKITDLLDTVFFVVRKKQSHVTFLHVYHHTIMVMSTWVFLKYVRGEQVVAIGLLNTFVHVCMYSYYFLAALGPKIQPYLWWKPYITRIQLAQFVLVLIYMVSLLLRECEVPKYFSTYCVLNGFVFLYLFSQFYIKAYVKKKSS